jgi:peptidoglycan-associated lipoprotein
MKNLALLLFCCLPFGMMFAQPLGGSSYEGLLEEAEMALAQNNYADALENLEEAYDKRDEEALVPQIAYLNYKLRDYRRAERFYRQAFRRVEVGDTSLDVHRFYYGRVLKAQVAYPDAIDMFEQFLASGYDDERLRQLARIEIEGARLAMGLGENTQGVTIERMDNRLLSPFSEYAPTMSPDLSTLYFSGWDSNDIIEATDPNDPELFSRIFSATMKDSVTWNRPEPLAESVNRPGVHTVNPFVSPDGRRLYYNRVIMEGNEPKDARVYWSVIADDGWSSGNEVDGINGDYRVLQPSVGELFGNEVLFFASDMPGGYGGYDLYYATYRGEGNYAEPVNLGPTINSVGDEFTPFYFEGTLYYSTDGKPSIGGLDIYYSVWDGSTWSEPENMGVAFNSSVDDLSFRMVDEGYTGFMTSNREGGRSVKSRTCCDDIYAFTIPRLYAELVVGLFTDDRQPLVGGTTYLVPMLNDEPGRPLAKTQPEGNRFDYGLELDYAYMLIGTHPDYYPDTVYLNTAGLTESKTFTERMYLAPKPVEPKYDTIRIEEAIVLENILYDFDRDNIRPDAEPDLEYVYELMTEYPDMKIELGSHTDARGDADYNRGLSQRRAESARRWLMRKGIERNRIEAKGYGKTVPQTVSARIAERFDFLTEGDILTEAYIASLPSEEQEEIAHQLNRRTEFRILEGPTSIVIERARLQKTEESESAPNRNSQPVDRRVRRSAPSPNSSQAPALPDPVISPLSSLYGQQDLRNVPIMQFKQRTFDLGTVKKGDKRTMSYEFVNAGDADLEISIISHCDCTTTEYDTGRVYKPGEGGTIKVIFDSSDKDEAETIDVDIFLEQVDPKGNPIIEMLQYSFDIER